jgi:FAD/FMN-containing dehydrogenase
MTQHHQTPQAAVDDRALAALHVQVAGDVLVPGHKDSAQQTSLYNLHLPLIPDVVVLAESASDVQAAVRYAAERKMPLAVKSTGHQVPLPAAGGLLINTDRMKGLRIDPERHTARAEAGVRWEQVLEEAAPYGLTPMPGPRRTSASWGTCSAVV